VGQISRIGGASVLGPVDVARTANEIQTFLRDRTRLGIPAIIHEECLHGVMAAKATIFPQAIGLACTWDPALAKKMAQEMREQLLAVGARQGLAPVLDISREPRWGRLEETFGEDAFLAAQFAIAYVKGLQGPDLRCGVIATGKSFVGYGVPESGINCAPPQVGQRDLLDVFVVPYAAAIKEAGLGSVMTSYNDLDGVPCTASRELLQDLLRDQLGFEGILVADYCAINNLFETQKIAASELETVKLALEAGLDLDLNHGIYYGRYLPEAIGNGLIAESVLDASVRRVLTKKFELGLFERCVVPLEGILDVYDNSAQRHLAREVARKSIVLLKNEGELLPLSKNLRSLAVLGPNADYARAHLGDYGHMAHTEAGIIYSSKRAELEKTFTPERLWDYSVPVTSVLAGIRDALPRDAVIRHARGCGHQDRSTDGFAEAIAAAEASDVVVMVMGGVSGFCGNYTSGEGCDRADLDLPGVQLELIQEIHKTGKPIVVVIIDGRPLALPWVEEHIPASMMAWLPGEEGGNAIADVLFGGFNPAGRLAVSLPRSVGQLPVYYSKKARVYNELRAAEENRAFGPLYAFGHGLSYTRFAYRSLHLNRASASAGESVEVSVVVENTGTRDGEEVVQLYCRDVAASVTRPVKQLVGFARIPVPAGELRTVVFDLPINLLAFTRLDRTFGIEPGLVKLMAGASSSDIRLEADLHLVGETPAIPHRARVYTCPFVISKPSNLSD
jgi:beta-glucosidase